jgi:photosystem II stability/assembly factor-like uncharacterized protein
MEQRAKLLGGAVDSPIAIDPSESPNIPRDLDNGIPDDELELRTMANLAQWGYRDPDFNRQLLQISQAEARRWPDKMPNAAGATGPNVEPLWTSLGPTGARFEWSSDYYYQVDSGRINALRADPRDSDTVYIVTGGGGVWKTTNATAKRPDWVPLTDTFANVSGGSLAIDAQNPDILYFGIGDPFDQTTGGAVLKSINGGTTWEVVADLLQGMYPASAGERTETATNIRDVQVDPNDPNTVMVSTEVGLFRSEDGGHRFSLLALPTEPDGTVAVESSAWSIAYLGTIDGQSQWLVSGVYACGPGLHPPAWRLSTGQPRGPACPRGNQGDLWRSTDGGATWISLRNVGRLQLDFPTPYPQQPELADVGRMAIATGNTDNPEATVVYIQASSINDGAYPTPIDIEFIGFTFNRTIAILKSVDGGRTFAIVARENTPVTNPTTFLPESGTSYCAEMNVGHSQTYYNEAIGVDPADSNRVLIGGNFCGVRTTDGGQTWSNVAHWLPIRNLADTEEGTLKYVHADWHDILLVRRGTATIAFVGGDGGIFRAFHPFDVAPPAIDWVYLNRGITTHQFYNLSSGDPAEGDESIVFGGLQDNGTRMRDPNPDSEFPESTFNQIQGGDGFGSLLSHALDGVVRRQIFFLSVNGARFFCVETAPNLCRYPGPQWQFFPLFFFVSDSDLFTTRYAPIAGDPAGAFLTPTFFNVVRMSYPLTGPTSPPFFRFSVNRLTTPTSLPAVGIRDVVAAPREYRDGSGPFRLYGVILSGGRFSVGIDRNTYSTETTDYTPRSVTWNNAPTPIGVGPAPSQRQAFGTSMDFPADARHFGGIDGQVFLAATTAPKMADELTLVPPEIGHLFLTQDGGQTWLPFGTKGQSPLPNVPIQLVRFDPNDDTDNTIYVGNDIGVYQSRDRGLSWTRFEAGLPLARVTGMFISRDSSLIRVSTYGRGLWEVRPGM